MSITVNDYDCALAEACFLLLLFFFFNFQVEIELRDETRLTGHMAWNKTNTNINFI